MITKEKVETAIAAGVINFSHDTAGHRICKIGERGFHLPETTGASSDSDDALTVFTMLDAYKTNPYDWDEYDYFDAVLSQNDKTDAVSLPYQRELSWLLDEQDDTEKRKRLDDAYIAASLIQRHLSFRSAAALVEKYENAVMRFGTHMWPNEAAYALGAAIDKYSIEAVLALDDDTFWRMLHDAAFHQMMSKMTAFDCDVAVNHKGRRFRPKKNEYTLSPTSATKRQKPILAQNWTKKQPAFSWKPHKKGVINMSEQNKNTTTKSYSFLNIKKCVGKKDKPFYGITVSGLVVNPTGLEKTASGREYIRFSMPVQNQGPRIWRACEVAPQTDDNGTVWANVSFWDTNAHRFLRYLERHPHAVIVVTGSLRVEKSTSTDGTVYTNTTIYGDDFMHVRDIRQKAAEEKPQDEAPKQDTPQVSETQPDADADDEVTLDDLKKYDPPF